MVTKYNEKIHSYNSVESNKILQQDHSIHHKDIPDNDFSEAPRVLF